MSDTKRETTVKIDPVPREDQPIPPREVQNAPSETGGIPKEEDSDRKKNTFTSVKNLRFESLAD